MQGMPAVGMQASGLGGANDARRPVTAAVAVAAVIWGWAVAQYPRMLQPNLTIAQAVATRPVLMATLICLSVGSALLVPSLAWLYLLFQRRPTHEES